MPSVPAVEFLDQKKRPAIPAVVVVHGDDMFLRAQSRRVCRDEVLGGDDGQFSLTALEGRVAPLRDVLDELATTALFGGGRRMVIVAEADEFVSKYREALEDYVAKPRRGAVLLLDVERWPSNTRLAKAVASSGLAIDCSAPAEGRLPAWCVAWARTRHQATLARDAAESLVEIVGPELGLLDQELAKLAAAVPAGEPISTAMVRELVGGWRAQTVWAMLDMAADGNAAQAIEELDRLLAAGENPIAILGQIASSLRRFATATRLIEAAEDSGRKMPVRAALEAAGVKPFVLSKAEGQLRQLGRERAGQLHAWLLEADLDLKGASHLPPRVVLERLIVRLARQLAPAREAARR